MNNLPITALLLTSDDNAETAALYDPATGALIKDHAFTISGDLVNLDVVLTHNSDIYVLTDAGTNSQIEIFDERLNPKGIVTLPTYAALMIKDPDEDSFYLDMNGNLQKYSLVDMTQQWESVFTANVSEDIFVILSDKLIIGTYSDHTLHEINKATGVENTTGNLPIVMTSYHSAEGRGANDEWMYHDYGGDTVYVMDSIGNVLHGPHVFTTGAPYYMDSDSFYMSRIGGNEITRYNYNGTKVWDFNSQYSTTNMVIDIIEYDNDLFFAGRYYAGRVDKDTGVAVWEIETSRDTYAFIVGDLNIVNVKGVN